MESMSEFHVASILKVKSHRLQIHSYSANACQNEYAATILLIISLGFSKLAVVSFVHNLTPSSLHRKINLGVTILVSSWLVCSVLVAAFECRLPHTWDRRVDRCVDRVSGLASHYTFLD